MLLTLNETIFFNLLEGEIQQVLEEILRSILKNGIPDFGVPPLDPFVYNDIISISDYDMSGIMT
jgi:hypothetical protein